MKKKTPLFSVFGLLFLVSPVFSYAASWSLDSKASAISFVSVKKTNIAEAHSFSSFSGKISDSGVATVAIDTNSVKTGVDIRDQRMVEFLFKSVEFPHITITSSALSLEKYETGSSQIEPISATLSLHGKEQEISMDVIVHAVSPSKLAVSTAKPVIVKAKDFGLSDGIAKLSSLVGDISIGTSVPVSFSLTFVK